MNREELASGQMPGIGQTYEDLEGLFCDIYQVCNSLEDGGDRDIYDCMYIEEILNRFAYRYGLQLPSEAVENPRESNLRNKEIEELTCAEVYSMTRSILSVFAIGQGPETIDFSDRIGINNLFLGLLYRHGIVDIDPNDTDNKKTQIPLKILKHHEFMSMPFVKLLSRGG